MITPRKHRSLNGFTFSIDPRERGFSILAGTGSTSALLADNFFVAVTPCGCASRILQNMSTKYPVEIESMCKVDGQGGNRPF